MNNGNLEITDNFLQPDPAWDYYEIWQALHGVKRKIDAALKLIASEEQADNTTDEKLKETLEPALTELEGIIENDLTNYSDDGDY